MTVHASASPKTFAVRSQQFISLFDTQWAHPVSHNGDITSRRGRFVLRELDVIASRPRHASIIVDKPRLVPGIAGVDAASPPVAEAVVAGLRLRLVVANQFAAVVDYPLPGLQGLRCEQTPLTKRRMVGVGDGSDSHQFRRRDATRGNRLVRRHKLSHLLSEVGIDPRVGQIEDGHVSCVGWPTRRAVAWRHWTLLLQVDHYMLMMSGARYDVKYFTGFTTRT